MLTNLLYEEGFSLRPRGRSGLKFFRGGRPWNRAWSPSSWAEWVEMRIDDTWLFNPLKSPSSWAEWVEIPAAVLLLTVKKCLRPRGRSGLKSSFVVVLFPVAVSPSSWAEWVEIYQNQLVS